MKCAGANGSISQFMWDTIRVNIRNQIFYNMGRYHIVGIFFCTAGGVAIICCYCSVRIKLNNPCFSKSEHKHRRSDGASFCCCHWSNSNKFENNATSKICFLLILSTNTPPISAMDYIIETKMPNCKNGCKHAVTATSKPKRTSKPLRCNGLLVLFGHSLFPLAELNPFLNFFV